MSSSARIIFIGAIFVAGLAVGWAVTRFVPLPWLGATAAGGGDATAGGSNVDGALSGRDVVALGRIEPSGGIITVGAIPGDTLKTLNVSEGEFIAAGSEIGRLDSYQLRDLEIESIDARLAEAAAREAAETDLADSRILAAELAVEQAKAKGLELEAQKKQVDVLHSSLALEQKKLDTIANVSHDIISDEEKDKQRLLVQKLTAELAAAQATVENLQQTSQLAVRAAESDLEAARKSKEQIKATVPTASLEAGRKAAVEQRERSIIKAPADGTVLAVYVHQGEQIASQPVLQMADLRRMVCVAEVYETDVRRVQAGQSAVIHSKVFPPEVNEKGLRGKVVRVGNMIASAKLQPLDPFARGDRHVVEVRIELDPESAAQAARLVNLQVDVTIQTASATEQVATAQ